jgi:hypothetical protein
MKIAEILTETTNRITDDWFKDGFETYKKPAEEKYTIADQDGTIQTLEGPVSYKKGYYIMTGPKGEQYPIPPEQFRDLKDDQGNGKATPKKKLKMAKLADHDGVVNTSWGAKLKYTRGKDYIVKHNPGDYGVVKADIFKDTYVKEDSQTATEAENLDEITRRNLLKGIGATAAAGALGAKVDLAKAAGGPKLTIVLDNGAELDLGPFTSKEDAMKLYDEYRKIIAEFYMNKSQEVPNWELHLDGKPTGIKSDYPKGLGKENIIQHQKRKNGNIDVDNLDPKKVKELKQLIARLGSDRNASRTFANRYPDMSNAEVQAYLNAAMGINR